MSWLRALAEHERAVAAALTGIAVLAGLHVLRPAEARLTTVIAASHALTAGAALSASDLTAVRLPPRVVPAGALRSTADALGLTVAGPLARGELLTATRVLGPRLLDAVAPGSVAVPVRVADPAATRLVREGDHVDLLAVPTDGGPSAVVGANVVVLTTMPDEGFSFDEGALLVVAATPAVASTLTSAAANSRISLVLRGR